MDGIYCVDQEGRSAVGSDSVKVLTEMTLSQFCFAQRDLDFLFHPIDSDQVIFRRAFFRNVQPLHSQLDLNCQRQMVLAANRRSRRSSRPSSSWRPSTPTRPKPGSSKSN